MNHLFGLTSLVRVARDEEGATAIEYGLIAGLIAVVIIAVVTLIGTDLFTAFDTIENSLGGDQG